ncbi:MAG: DoxX family protein [Ignavibacteriales bacterium]|nr:DoxX family protein [Ignavibacteriales bacterium]
MFLVVGAAKIPALHQFTETITSITHLSFRTAEIIAVFIILIELLGGIALLFRFKVALVSSSFCIVISIFLWVLLSAILRDKEIQCNCFGILNVAFSNRTEFILDMLLFNLFALLALLSMKQPRTYSTNRRTYMIVSAAVVAYLQYSLVAFANKHIEPRGAPDVSFTVEYAENHNQSFASHKFGNRLLFLLSFSDFNCPPCFDDFQSFCDKLKMLFPKGHANGVLAIFKSDDMIKPDDPARLNHWAKANDFSFPLVIAPDSIFSKIPFKKSCIMVVDSFGNSVFSEIFPMGSEKHQTILHLLQKPLINQ